MTRALEQSLKKFRKVDDVLEILGTLGVAIGGEKFVEVPNRPPFVYVQLRNNQNELIQAFNDKVSPVYGLPVVVVRQGNRYVIKERDTQRYSDWQSYSPFLPRHGDQHSFNDMGGGGDVVWVYGKQFMPMLVTPSGSLGGPNVLLDPYVIQTSTGGWLYAGATGTANIVQHKPTGSTAIMVLVYVNQNDGNPYLIINSGTHFNNILTGTSQIVPYLPFVTNSTWLPAFAVRLVSGTSTIGWDNLYDVRQYYHSIIPTGTTGGTTVDVQDEGVAQGSASTFNFVGAGVTASVAGGLATINIPGGGTSSGVYKNPGSVLFAGADGYPDEDNLRLFWDNTNHIFRVGPPSPSALLTSSTLNNQNVAVSQNTAATYAAVTYGTGTSGSPAPVFAGYRMRGTPSAPTAIADNDTLQLLVGAGYDGSNFINAARIRQSAWGDWSALGAAQGSKIEFEWIPSGTATRIIGASFRDQLFNVSGSINIPANQTYNISGSPHSHLIGGYPCDFVLTLQSGNPYPSTNASGTILYITPSGHGNQISLFNGAKWNTYASNEFSLTLTGTAGRPYDIFVYDNNGTPAAEMLSWATGTARSTALAYQDGVLVKSGASTRRYVGTVYMASANFTVDSSNERYVWSYYNHRPKPMGRIMVAPHTYAPGSLTYRQWNNDTNARMEYVVGVDEYPLLCSIAADCYNGNGPPLVGFGVDVTNTANFELGFTVNSSTNQIYGGAGGQGYYGIGYHSLNIIERASNVASNFTAFYSTASI